MKKLFLFLSVFVTHSMFAQQNILEPGTYISNTKTGQDVKLVIDSDNKFHITLLSGTLEQQNDSIHLRTKYDTESMFQVEFVTSTTKPKTVKIDFGQNNYYSLYDIHFGTQKISDLSPEYKTVSEYLNIDENQYEYSENEQLNLSFEVEPMAFLYLANESYNGTTIEKFEVPVGVSEIKILKRSDLFAKLKLKGKYNTTTKEFTVSEGRTPIVFKKEQAQSTGSDFIKPIESLQKQYWTYPGKEDRYNVVDSTVVDSYDYDDNYTPPYTFKLKTEKTFNDALKVAQSYPNKILVVFYDLSSDAPKNFEKYIKSYENQIQDYMYDKYEPELDQFDFYLAGESDKNALKKMGITEDKTVVFLNSDGTKIHHAKGNLKGYEFKYYNLSNIASHLQVLDSKAKLDKLMLDKKATIQQFQKTLYGVSGKPQINYYDSLVDVALPPPAAVNQYGNNAYDYDAVVDTAAVAAVEEYDLPQKQNAYQFKSSQSSIALKYKQILDFYQKEKAINEELVHTIIAELSGQGFSQKLFNANNDPASAVDFQSMDYLFQFYNEIEAMKSEPYALQTSQKMMYAVCKMLAQSSNENQKEKVKAYYDKLLTATRNNSTVYRQIVNQYANSENKAGLIDAYSQYFNSIAKPNTNLIEVLDANYQSEKARQWDAYKSDFANLANNTAWYVVENSNDKTEIQKAIQWSETSLKLEPNNHYYLDTLAQLYYKNGEKEKGMLLEQKAIDSAMILNVTEAETYKKVLEKMKNGTY